MTKDCLEPDLEVGCQSASLVRPVCFYECNTDYCNGIDGNRKSYEDYTGTTINGIEDNLFSLTDVSTSTSTTIEAFQCYSCTYLFAGYDGSAGYDCVNNTANFANTRTLSCELPKKCIIKSVYERGYTKMLSMTKDCLEPDLEVGCQSASLVRPMCFYECNTDYCNGIDGNRKSYEDYKGTSTNGIEDNLFSLTDVSTSTSTTIGNVTYNTHEYDSYYTGTSSKADFSYTSILFLFISYLNTPS